MKEESERPTSFCYSIRSSISTSALSTFSDEGYYSDQKPSFSSSCSSLLYDELIQEQRDEEEELLEEEDDDDDSNDDTKDKEEFEETSLPHDFSEKNDSENDLPPLLQSTHTM